jgi:hypothetical protein
VILTELKTVINCWISKKSYDIAFQIVRPAFISPFRLIAKGKVSYCLIKIIAYEKSETIIQRFVCAVGSSRVCPGYPGHGYRQGCTDG